MKKLVPFLLLISMPIIIGAMEAPEIEEQEVGEVEAPSLGTMPAEIKLDIIKRAFWGIVDVNKSVEDNIKNLFLQRKNLMANTELRNLVSDEEILKLIGKELSTLLNYEEYGELGPYTQFLDALVYFANNPDVLIVLTYVNKNGYTLLHKAAFNNDLNAIDILLAAGANVNAQDATGNTPLHSAIWAFGGTGLYFGALNERAIETIKKLRAAGADATIKNNAHNTPLDFARILPAPPVVQQLLTQPSTQSTAP